MLTCCIWASCGLCCTGKTQFPAKKCILALLMGASTLLRQAKSTLVAPASVAPRSTSSPQPPVWLCCAIPAGKTTRLLSEERARSRSNTRRSPSLHRLLRAPALSAAAICPAHHLPAPCPAMRLRWEGSGGVTARTPQEEHPTVWTELPQLRRWNQPDWQTPGRHFIIFLWNNTVLRENREIYLMTTKMQEWQDGLAAD